ncbi:hypothetical protein MKX01_015798 [Papaver californicum]|nr:hypothetical protein MKX01_015798 [Papaver californicum]
MENYYTPTTNPSDSRDSSPRSSTREIDCENSWPDQEQNNYKVKFMCSYGGKILPRPHDNQLTYIGGETKILSVDRSIKFSGIISKLNSLSDYNDVYFKYQLPGEDLDALISVTNDEDLEHMMIEFDRLIINHRSNSGSNGGSNKHARLRLFLFSLNNNNNPSSPTSSNVPTDNQKARNQQWFVDALNSVNNPIMNQSLDSSVSSPPAAVKVASDFLFGFEKAQLQNNNNIPAKQQQQQTQQQEIRQELHRDVSDQSLKKLSAGSDSSAKEEIRQMVGETVVSRAEIQRQINEIQRLQIANHEQAMFQRQTDEMLARAFHGDHYIQQIPDQQPKLVPVMAAAAATATTVTPVASSQVPTLPTNVPTGYWQQQERQVPVSGGYHVGPSGIIEHPPPPLQQHPQQQQQQQTYLLHAPAGYAPNNMYQQTRPVSGQVSQGPQQGYYGMMQQRVMQDVYREPVYGMGPPPPQPTRMVGGGYGDGVSMVRPPALPASGVPVGTESGYTTQMGYDNTGRQVYYTTAGGGGGVVVPTTFQTDARQTTGVVNQDGIAKVVLKTAQPQ